LFCTKSLVLFPYSCLSLNPILLSVASISCSSDATQAHTPTKFSLSLSLPNERTNERSHLLVLVRRALPS
jgi:hypothetical protein